MDSDLRHCCLQLKERRRAKYNLCKLCDKVSYTYLSRMSLEDCFYIIKALITRRD